jgi:hypothetical protein
LPRDTSTPSVVAQVVVPGGQQPGETAERLRGARIKGLLLFPRCNSTLSTYLKNSRFRTRASVTLAAAAAAAGVGVAASAGATTAPWSASLGNMAQAAHGSTNPAALAGTDAFGAVLGTTQGSHAASQQGSSKPVTAAKVAARQQRGSADPVSSELPILRALQPLPVVQLPVGQPKAAAPKAAAPKAAAPKAMAAKAVAAKAVAPKAAPKAAHKAPVHKAAAPAKPYTIYDSVTPSSIPSGARVATYANGNYAASWAQVHGRHNVLWIDTNGSNPGANILDVEPGDATPTKAAEWVQVRLAKQPNAIAVVYTMRSEWQQVQAAVGNLPGKMQSHVRYWIADPTGYKHIVPGSSATQWYWGANYDISTVLPGFEN